MSPPHVFKDVEIQLRVDMQIEYRFGCVLALLYKPKNLVYYSITCSI